MGLLENRAIPLRRAGKRGRVRLSDVLAHGRGEELTRRRTLDELTAETEHLGIEN